MALTGTTLSEHLAELSIEPGLIAVLEGLAKVEKEIYDTIDLRAMVKAGATNVSGDTQSGFDVTAEDMIVKALDANTHVCSHLSEECEAFRTCSATGTYFVSYDPYDGGSVGDANVTVGSIFGIWSEPPMLGNAVGKGMVASAYGLWGPRLTFAFATREHGVLLYQHDGSAYRFVEKLDFDSAGRASPIFGPSDITSLQKDPAYEALFRYCLASKLKLRYAGAMVTDIHHVLTRGGMFWYAPNAKKPLGHLRLLYECAPLGFAIIAAGGTAIDHTGRNMLDVVINEWHQRSPILAVSPQFAAEASKLFLEIGKA